MKVNLRTRFFLWLLLLLILFVLVQTVVYGVVELTTLFLQPGLDAKEQLMEVVVGVSMDFILLPVLALAAWWISSYMIRPVRTLAVTADEIGRGKMNQRVDTSAMPDDEMRSLAVTLNRAFDQYTETISRLDRFSSDASHQLRTPLASIRTQAELGLTREREPEEYREVLSNILEDVARLSRLVEQLMTMARLDGRSGGEGFATFDLPSLVRMTSMLYQEVCEAEGMSIETDMIENCRIMGSSDLIREALRNLIDNAMKHAGAGCRIRVELKQDGDEVVLAVMDTGPGVPPDQSKAIFDRFHQVQPSSAEGSGLGLALAAQIVRIHGGTIELVSREGWGAVFEIRLKKS